MTEDVKLPAVDPGAQLQAAAGAKPVVLRKVLEEMGLIGPHVEAKDLVDETFIIFRAKWAQSTFDENAHYYFCHCVDPETSEIFTTSLGGGPVVELIDAYIGAGEGKPIQVTLRFAEGRGSFEGYYFLE